MHDAVQISLFNFTLIYLLLIVVGVVMKISQINQTKLLLVASVRMTLQLTLAGYVLTYIFDHPSPLLVCAYVTLMSVFAVYRILSVNKGLNNKFKAIIAVALTLSALCIMAFFITTIIGESIFNPRYTIPISGMIIGNAMTGITLGVKTFISKIKDSQLQIEVLLNQGAKPESILKPFVHTALETALLPTLNTMLGMGIVSLPGMMTGQILSGELPTTAILYQISINICLAAVVSLAVYLVLNLGYRTLYNKENQFIL